MKISGIEYADGFLKLRVPYNEVFSLIHSFKAGEYTLSPIKKKRSLNANAYAWKLMTLIAEKVRRPVEEIYRNELESVTGIREQVLVKDEAVEQFKRAFIGDHDGRKVENIGFEDGWTELLLFYGSSDFDTRQMSELLDAIIQDCSALGINYDTEKVRSLLEDYEKRIQRTARQKRI